MLASVRRGGERGSSKIQATRHWLSTADAPMSSSFLVNIHLSHQCLHVILLPGGKGILSVLFPSGLIKTYIFKDTEQIKLCTNGIASCHHQNTLMVCCSTFPIPCYLKRRKKKSLIFGKHLAVLKHV